MVNSHHDLILSSFPLIFEPVKSESIGLIQAPKLENTCVKVRWDDSGIDKYKLLVSKSLARLRAQADSDMSANAFSLLLTATNDILSSAAQASNKFTDLSRVSKARSTTHPDIRAAQAAQLAAVRHHRATITTADPSTIAAARQAASSAKAETRRLCRTWQTQVAAERDSQVSSILEDDPRRLFAVVESSLIGAGASLCAAESAMCYYSSCVALHLSHVIHQIGARLGLRYSHG